MPPKKKKLCFVLMPFKDEMKEVYWKAIKPAAGEAGFECLRMDEVKGVYNINKKIIEHIFQSDAIVSDLSEKNPNVFYEMGVAHAIANKTLMIIRKGEEVPFDVHSYRCIPYDQTEVGLNELKKQIIEELECIGEWCHAPNNPVQEFKPYDALVPRSELSELENEKSRSIALLMKKMKSAEQELTHAKQELGHRPKQTEVLDLEKKVEQLALQLQQTKNELEQRPQQAEFLALKNETDLLRASLKEKEEAEKNLRAELHQIKVTWDEADKKKPAETKIIPPAGMVLIPAGEFVMGTSEEQIEKLLKKYPDLKQEWLEWEKPAHKVWLDAFFMDQFLVTNTQFAEFLNDWGKETDEDGQKMIEEHTWGVHKRKDRWEAQPGFEKHPIICATWYGAQQYARWAKKQLPTEAQWEKAARGGKDLEYGTKDGTISPKLANYADSKIEKTTPVGNYPANPYGLFDMSGNAWEWCQDWFDEIYYQKSPAKNPTGPETGAHHVVRGGSWGNTGYVLQCSFRSWFNPVLRYDNIGFRECYGA